MYRQIRCGVMGSFLGFLFFKLGYWVNEDGRLKEGERT